MDTIQVRKVWSGWLRISHWLITFGLIFQWLSAWVFTHTDVDLTFWVDWHLMVGQIIVLAVLLRLGLLLVPGSSHWRALIPRKNHWQAVTQMFKFYLSFGRFPLPNWFAHNPLWLPLYTVMYLLLFSVLLTGMFQGFIGGHQVLAGVLMWLVIGHVVAVVLHDFKGQLATVSGMINGFRYFHFEQSAQDKKNEYIVPLDALKPRQSDDTEG
ncbi:MAG: cytochrome b/b6 domain-containing protein [Methylococcales bacterium]|jgi:Ni/Fe-hydrogenase 1 B-type cytochrome subunit|nr:cytochrome b/b6 domain-containing protein [Methylococcales bacterium]MBT7444265.1 cytochrome b/b6 domain-containing protein [Methylococcales bacterium]